MAATGLLQRARKSSFKWQYVDNLRPLLSYRLASKAPLRGEAGRVLGELNKNGIAITSAEALLGPGSCFAELKAAVEGLGRARAPELALSRARSSEQNLEKAFKYSYVVGNMTLDENSVFVRFALQRPIVRIANAYFGMYTHLRFVNVWHTFSSQSQSRDSQLWHRDRDDRYIVKVFVYLSDVDESAGPFTYAPGTHLKGSVRGEPRYVLDRPGGPKRSRDAEMAEVVPEDRWVKAVGPAGTIIFADTRGYHCGGRARGRDRIMYIGMFASSASAKRADGFIECDGSTSAALDKEQTFALRAARG